MRLILLFLLFTTSLFGQKRLDCYPVENPNAELYTQVTTNGAWCWFSDPRAIYADGVMIGGCVDDEGNICAFSFNPTTKETKSHILFHKLDYDDHANPSFLLREDGRVTVFFSAHGGTKNSPIYYTTTKNGNDISAWEPLKEINPEMPGKLGLCYTNPFTLSDEKNKTYVFFRGRDFKPTWVETFDFKTWSEAHSLVKNDEGKGNYGRPYLKASSNNKDKIFFAFTDGHPRDQPANSIYFMYYKQGAFYRASGERIASSEAAITPAQVDKVYDATAKYDKAWIWDIAFDEKENPVIVYARFSDRDQTHSYWYAKWDGQSWNNKLITKAGSWFQRNNYVKEKPEYECNYSGGVYLDHEDPTIVYTSRPINNVFEIEKWQLIGSKFEVTPITSNSRRDNVRPFVARYHNQKNPALLWMYNYDFPNFKNYRSCIRINDLALSQDATLTQEAISRVAHKVCDWQIRSFKNGNPSDNSVRGWLNAVCYNGIVDWATQTNNENYFKFLTQTFGRQYWQMGNRMYHGDDLCIGQAYLDLYQKYQKEYMLTPTKARLDWILTNNPKDNIDITKGASDRWWWCDAIYMAPATFIKLSNITGERKYLKFAHREFLATYEHLYDHQEALFYRDAKYFDKREQNGEKVFWGRGNGWVMAGLAEILKTLPVKEKKYRQFYQQLFIDCADRLVELQHKEGYWTSSLLDPQSYPNPEMSGTSLITYALAYGVNAGILPREKYLPTIEKAWEALVRSVDTEGRVGWTQLVAQKPGSVTHQDKRAYSSGAFLMLATELLQLY